ncbi:SCP-like extracellular [Sphingomonas piscis]|uniref:SCP-like extracellular n=1 Tax=Sphingomonas piscis TaxID=2714943 RepID=A0A6G7YQU7_9SPHN|nr:CAP domain-containing protein [Sphingomonas piscis]QIK79107.1 SCP-like extracellular [Sphingomonas piscis]
MRFYRRSNVATLALGILAPFLLGASDFRVDFNERILAEHNRERKEMSVAPLQWDDELAAGAREWARYLSRTGRFEHSPDSPGQEPLGENIWGGTPAHYSPEQMVRLWIAEKKNYQPGVFPSNSRSGRVEDVSHYTQLIWRRTTRVGCALSGEGEEEILVCRYSSPGNVIGQPA